MSSCCSHDHSDHHKPEDQKREPAPPGTTFSAFHIQAMDCPTEQSLIQSKLGSLAGIHQLDFNLMTRVLGVQHSLPSVTPIIDVIASLGMQAEPTDAHVQTRIRIEQMDCPTEEKLICDKLANQKGISNLQFNPLTDQKRWERNIEAKYVVQSGSLKDMSFRVRQMTTRATDYESDLDEVRLIVEYPLEVL